MRGKWTNLLLLAGSCLLAMSLWFSASAVVPELTRAWALTRSEASWLTMSVQIGFVAGAIVSALTNLADRIAPPRLIALSAFIGAAANGLIAFAVDGLALALVLRFITGMTLAGVYPPGMKLMTTWCKTDRGLGIGLLVGAITVGSASPHLFGAVPGLLTSPDSWRVLLGVASASAVVAAIIAGAFVKPGPYLSATPKVDWRVAKDALADRPVRLANFGYLGHMWELYAMWTWVPILILESYAQAGLDRTWARFAGFAIVAIGGAGSLLAGIFADRIGRTTVTIASLVVSGACCFVAGFFFDAPYVLTAVCLVWGFAVVADSAQFSTAVSELSNPRYVGTALTVQTSLGFVLTLFTIRLIPPFVEWVSWRYAFWVLALGPVFGIVSMARLRGLPEAEKLASGNR